MDKYNFDLIVFCHLRWEFVTQRPQHILSRIAKDHRVLFVEEPIAHNNENYGTANIIRPQENVVVLQPRISGENYAKEIAPLLRQQIKALKLRRNPVVWFYSGAFVEVLDYLDNYELVVYDCMDELSAFLGAPKDLIEKEKKLLRLADVVFTGGRSLYESKSKLTDNVFCFPSSVDQAHFEKALDKKTVVPEDIRKIKHPIIGYYGVIDERIDLDLLSQAAKKLPNASFVMIGPVVKISEADLPKAPNIHFLGGKSYDDLPAYLRAFDICMMPFALNESTKFISPTKTLEFMAAKKPIVSTPVRDVARSFIEGEVGVAANTNEFVEIIEGFLKESVKDRKIRVEAQEKYLQKTSWIKTVAQMLEIISRELDAVLSTSVLTARTV